MEFISISTSCFAANNAVSKTTPAIRLFIREVREARPELDAALAEMHSLDGVLDILKDDAASFPLDLARRTPALLEHCTAIINQMEGYMHVCNAESLTAREKKFRWLAIRGDLDKLRLTLEGYKSILAVVTDLVALTRKSSPTNDATLPASGSESQSSAAQDGGQDAAGGGQGGAEGSVNQEDMQHELTHVMADMGSLRGRLQGDFRSNYAVSDLESYLDAMLLQATHLSYQIGRQRGDIDSHGERNKDKMAQHEQQRPQYTFLHDDDDEEHSIRHREDQPLEPPKTPQIPRRAARRSEDIRDKDKHGASPRSNSSSLGDEPDSAIDINDSSSLPYHRSPGEAGSSRSSERDQDRDLIALHSSSSPPSVVHPPLPIVEIDELLDELNRHPATRAPTPPPRARARNNSLALRDGPSLSVVNASSQQQQQQQHQDTATENAFSSAATLAVPRPPSVARSLSEYSTALHDPEDTSSGILAPERRSSYRRSRSGLDDEEDDGDAVSTLGDLMGIRPPFKQRELTTSSASSFSSSYSTAPTPRMAPTSRGYDLSRNQAVITTTIVGGPAAANTSTTATGFPPRKSSITMGSITSRPSSSSSAVHRPAPAPSEPPTTTTTTTTTTSSRPPSAHASRLGRSTSRLFGRKSSFSIPARPTRPASSSALRDHALGSNSVVPGSATTAALPQQQQQQQHASKPSTDTTITNPSSTCHPSAPASSAAGSVRSTGSRLSTVFSRVSFWRPRNSNQVNSAASANLADEDLEPDDIFGVSLKKSMQIASASVRTHHDGSKSSSRRDFPRCVLLCVSFIKNNGGVRAPNLFGGDYTIGGGRSSSSMVRVAALREAFSTAPHYGEGNIDWAAHDVYDAAELIVLFLQQLRKPLITETVAKRWIAMSRQATLPGSMGARLDSCIDFWDEALLGVRGAARSLFKLLLNLWGDVADAAEVNDMTAERLAARLLNPLMHLPAGNYTTDYMLGLAFLIRKRSEYAIMLREGRHSHAAF